MRRALHPERRGLTLVELMLAAGLAAVVMVAIVRLIDAASELWTKGEQRRSVVEQAAATAELMARDLRALHAGARGDLFVDWFPHDVERDGKVERLWPRLRFVRAASPADLARLRAQGTAEAARVLRANRDEDTAGVLSVAELEAVRQGADVDDPAALPPVDLASVGLMEVVWAVVPRASKGEARYEGLLVRGERLLAPNSAPELLAPEFFARNGRPPVDRVEEVTGGVLWCDVRLATQTTALDGTAADGGWGIGRDLTDAATSWDAFGLGRPNPELHVWNEPPAGMPAAGPEPLLPRRIRIELEIERPRDTERRTRLAADVELDAVRVEVENGEGLAPLVGRDVLVDGEWLRVKSVIGDAFLAERAQRGSSKRRLPAGAMVHFGEPLVVDIPIALHRDDWTLAPDQEARR